MKIVLEVSEDNEATDSPWWVLIDPKTIQQIMEGVAEHGELPSTDYILGVIACSIEGPYLSRKEAEDYLQSRHYAYSNDAKVWCASGYRADQYKQAIRRSRDLNKALNTIKGEKVEEQNCINTDTPEMKEITSRFSFHKPDETGVSDMRTIRRLVRGLAYHIELLCPESREKATALTQLATVMMHANSAIVQKFPVDEKDV